MTKIDEESEPVTGRTQIIQHLSTMLARQLRYGLQFDNDFVKTNEVCDVTLLKRQPLVFES